MASDTLRRVARYRTFEEIVCEVLGILEQYAVTNERRTEIIMNTLADLKNAQGAVDAGIQAVEDKLTTLSGAVTTNTADINALIAKIGTLPPEAQAAIDAEVQAAQASAAQLQNAAAALDSADSALAASDAAANPAPAPAPTPAAEPAAAPVDAPAPADAPAPSSDPNQLPPVGDAAGVTTTPAPDAAPTDQTS